MTDQTLSAETVDNTNAPPQVSVAKHPTQAHYYEITDARGDQRAALNVVLNAQMRVLHAELWLYDRFSLSESLQAEIYRQAKRVVETDYLSAGHQGNGFKSDFRVLDGRLLNEESVTHTNPDPRYRAESYHRLWPYITTYAAAVLVLLLFLLLNRTLLRPDQPATSVADSASSVALRSAVEEGAVAAQAMASSLEDEPMPPANTNGLPPSIKADSRLQVGMTARILPGYRSFVRSQPGPDAGEPVGVLDNSATARLLGGPEWLAGNTDTIVWWYVETESGIRGWTPANTSELTLLEPAE